MLLLLLVAGVLQGCSKFLNKPPFDSLTPSAAFSNANDLTLYTNSFYNSQIPAAETIYTTDNTSDYISGNNIPALMTAATNANNDSAWSFTELRNINYFLQNNTNPTIPIATRNSYNGIARFFRAWFYYDLVRKYGDVPWYGYTLTTTDSSLYKPRDPRSLVMDSIVADLDYAVANAPAAKDITCSQVTKWTALALEARICLFEGTFRKYHTELNLAGTAATFLTRAANAADTLIASGQYKLHNTNNPTTDYRALFTTETPWSDEVILASVYSTTLKKYHEANEYFTSLTLGNRTSPIKSFMDTYLNLDGTAFTDTPSFDTIIFFNETKNRDYRMQQTIRCNGYKRSDGTPAPPDYSYSYTGYQMLKFMLDDKTLDNKVMNTNSIPIFRYAEVLLDYAEARSELGLFTPTDWTNTIAPLRARAGITGTAYPTTADAYLQSKYYPNISDAALLEIRRERGVELFCEGLRFDDLRRWKAGNLISLPYDGVYVPQLNTPYAMNGDGVLDVSFVTAAPTSGVIPGVAYYVVNGTTATLTQGDHGKITWLANTPHLWDDKYYYYPIATRDIVLNPNLTQNPGW
jgi:starch-binding outer membrane protein, SusD/RagB family